MVSKRGRGMGMGRGKGEGGRWKKGEREGLHSCLLLGLSWGLWRLFVVGWVGWGCVYGWVLVVAALSGIHSLIHSLSPYIPCLVVVMKKTVGLVCRLLACWGEVDAVRCTYRRHVARHIPSQAFQYLVMTTLDARGGE